MKSAERPLLGTSACLADAEGRILLVKRGRPPFEGLLSLPGGKVRFGERLEEAVRREVLEEARVSVGKLTFLTLHEAIAPDTHAVIAVYAGLLPSDCHPVAGDDANAVTLVARDTIARLEHRRDTTPGLAGIVDTAARVLTPVEL